MKLLAVCPTRGRPELCRRMLDSFFATIWGDTHLCIYVDCFDPMKSDYERVFYRSEWPPRFEFQFGPRVRVPDVYNSAALACSSPKAPYFIDVNDDHDFITPGWDQKLIAELESHGGIGMAYGACDNLPTAAVVSRKCIEALGYWMYPKCKHQFVDTINAEIYREAGMLYHRPDVVIEHRHPIYNKGQWDETYKWIYSPEVEDHDRRVWQQWRMTERAGDIAKLKALRA